MKWLQLQAGLSGHWQPGAASGSIHNQKRSQNRKKAAHSEKHRQRKSPRGPFPRRPLPAGPAGRREEEAASSCLPSTCPFSSVSWRQTVRVQRVGASKPHLQSGQCVGHLLCSSKKGDISRVSWGIPRRSSLHLKPILLLLLLLLLSRFSCV